MTIQKQYTRTHAADQSPSLNGVGRSLPKTPVRFGQWAGTILFVVVAALAAGWLYSAKGGTTEVLVIDRALPAGQVIEEADLGSAQVAGVPDAFAVSDLDDVVGQRASTGLVVGQVLTPEAVTDAPVPGPDERMVAVRLEQGRVPETLRAGAVVSVLAVPPNGDAGNPEELDAPEVVADGATVYDVSSAVDGSMVVSLLVSPVDADRVAAYSAAGRVTVVQASIAGE